MRRYIVTLALFGLVSAFALTSDAQACFHLLKAKKCGGCAAAPVCEPAPVCAPVPVCEPCPPPPPPVIICEPCPPPPPVCEPCAPPPCAPKKKCGLLGGGLFGGGLFKGHKMHGCGGGC